MQHAVDVDGGDGSALQRRQQDAAQRVAERRAEAALQRFGHEGRDAAAVTARLDFELRRTDQFLPVLLVDLHLLCFLSKIRLPVRGAMFSHKISMRPP